MNLSDPEALPAPAVRRLGTTRFSHGEAISALAFSPDGARLASCSEGGIRVWETKTGQLLASTGKGRADFTRALAFSPDGPLLACGDEAGLITLCDSRSGERLRELRGHSESVRAVEFFHGGTRLASTARDGTVRIWDMNTGAPVLSFRAHEGWVSGLAVCADETRLFTLANRKVRCWSVHDGKPQWAVESLGGAAALAVSPDGQHLYLGCEDRIVVLSTASGQRINEFEPRKGFYGLGLACSRDGKLIAGHGGRDDEISVWSTSDTKRLASVIAPQTVMASSISPDGSLLAGASGQTILLWSLPDGLSLQERQSPVHSVLFSRDGTALIAGDRWGVIRHWDVRRGALVSKWQTSGEFATSLGFSSDDSLVAIGLGTPVVEMWDWRTPRVVRKLETTHKSYAHIALAFKGNLISSHGGGGVVQIWATADGSLVTTIGTPEDCIRSAALSADGGVLAAGLSDGRILFYDAQSGRLLSTRSDNDDPVEVLAFAPTSDVLAAASTSEGLHSNDVVLWSLGTHEPIRRLRGHADGVTTLAFSHDGRLLASVDRKGVIRLWLQDEGREFARFVGHTEWIRSVAFSPDGALLASGSEDGTVLLWKVDAR